MVGRVDHAVVGWVKVAWGSCRGEVDGLCRGG